MTCDGRVSQGVLVETFGEVVGRIVEDGYLHLVINAFFGFAGDVSAGHFPDRIAEEMDGVTHTDGTPCGVVILTEHTDNGVERIFLPFLLGYVAYDRRMVDHRAYLEVLERLVVLFNRQEVEEMRQLGSWRSVGFLLVGLEITGSLDRTLYLPTHFLPRRIGLDGEGEGSAVADEDRVQIIRTVTLDHAVEQPTAFGRTDVFGFPFRGTNGVLVVVVEQEKRVLFGREIITDGV